MRSPVSQLDRSLAALASVLKKAEDHATARKIDPAVLLADRLYPDMLPLKAQVLIACDHAKNGAHRMAAVEAPRFADDEATFAELQDRIARTREAIAAIPADAFEGAEGREVTIKLRGQDMTFPAMTYWEGFAIPNFYFHMATAYGILRHRGVEIGKTDFIGAAR